MSEKRISFKLIKWKYFFYFSMLSFFLIGMIKRFLGAI